MDSRNFTYMFYGFAAAWAVVVIYVLTLISRERWDEMMQRLGVDLDPSTRRANLLVSGIDLERSSGRVLRIGSIRLRINGETRPCEQMAEAYPGLDEVMQSRWGGGAFAEVLDDGERRVGDPVEWEIQPSAQGVKIHRARD